MPKLLANNVKSIKAASKPVSFKGVSHSVTVAKLKHEGCYVMASSRRAVLRNGSLSDTGGGVAFMALRNPTTKDIAGMLNGFRNVKQDTSENSSYSKINWFRLKQRKSAKAAEYRQYENEMNKRN